MSFLGPVEPAILALEDLDPEVLSTYTLLVSTTTSTAPPLYLKTAVGHSQPLWGPPDPYLSAGTSIAPSARALSDMGLTEQVVQQQHESWPQLAQMAVRDGVQVLDSAALQAESILPGFTRTGGILPLHHVVTAETPATFAAQVEWSAGFLNVVDKLPEAAFAYALVEFFFLRPGIDRYVEDVELEPTRAWTESVAVTGVRLGMFCLVAAVTTTIFG